MVHRPDWATRGSTETHPGMEGLLLSERIIRLELEMQIRRKFIVAEPRQPPGGGPIRSGHRQV